MSEDIWKRDEVESPCVKICVVHPEARICTGCLRSIDEITAWSRMSNEARRAVMAELPERQAGRALHDLGHQEVAAVAVQVAVPGLEVEGPLPGQETDDLLVREARPSLVVGPRIQANRATWRRPARTPCPLACTARRRKGILWTLLGFMLLSIAIIEMIIG